MTMPLSRILMAGSALALLFTIPALAQTPAAPAAAPAAAAAAAPAAAAADEEPAPPALPTTGDGAAVVKLLTNVCKPTVEGRGDFDTLAKAAGMTQDKNSGDYIMPLSQRPFQISIHKPGNQNLTVCEMRITYAPGWDQPIIDAMNTWRFLHSPQMHLQRDQIATFTDAQRTTITWDNWENQGFDGVMVGLTLNKLAKTDGTSATAGATNALIQYQVRTPLPEAVAAAKEAKAQHDRDMAKYLADKAAYDAAQAAAAAEAAKQAAAAQQATPATPTPAPATAPAS